MAEKKRGPGRPKGSGAFPHQIITRISNEALHALDEYRRDNKCDTFSDAVRVVIDKHVVKPKRRRDAK